MSTDNRLRDALDRALAEARARLEPDLRALTHELSDGAAAALASATEALDRARSLGDVLDALVGAARQYADRVGVLLVRDGSVRPWRQHGIGEDALSAANTDGVTTFPIAVGGQVVAILYAGARPSTAPILAVLTRYAGRVLESKTLHMAIGMDAP